MEHFISLIVLLLLLAASVFSIYILINFFEYLKKFQLLKWKEISFERPFGNQQENFYFYPIRPFKFILFLFSAEDIDDTNVNVYKKRIAFSLLLILSVLIIYSYILIIE